MKINNAVQVEFEAFGQIHIAYTETFNMESAENAIKKITDTAVVRGMKTEVIEEERFEELNMSKIIMNTKN